MLLDILSTPPNFTPQLFAVSGAETGALRPKGSSQAKGFFPVPAGSQGQESPCVEEMDMQTCTPVKCPKTYMEIGQGVVLVLLSIHRGIKQSLKQSHTMDNNETTVEVLLLKDAHGCPP